MAVKEWQRNRILAYLTRRYRYAQNSKGEGEAWAESQMAGATASDIANVTRLPLPSLSSCLKKKMVDEGRLTRKPGEGPRGGYMYYYNPNPPTPRATDPVPPPTSWKHILKPLV